MCETNPVRVTFEKFEGTDRRVSKQKIRDVIEKMLDKYPDDTEFDTVRRFICLGVVEKDKQMFSRLLI